MPGIYRKIIVVILTILLSAAGVKIFSRAPAAATKAEYLARFKQQSANLLCSDSAFMAFNQCFEFSQTRCQEVIQEVTSACIEALQHELPDKFDQAHARKIARWESKVAQCSGERVVKKLAKNKSESEQSCMQTVLKPETSQN